MATQSAIGQSITRGEGPNKVTGKSVYTADVSLPGMLWGKILRSPYPYARIVSIDKSKAEVLPGVYAVVTGQDIPETKIGRRMVDMPILAQGVVRFVGEKWLPWPPKAGTSATKPFSSLRWNTKNWTRF